jgi:hypothetical protein
MLRICTASKSDSQLIADACVWVAQHKMLIRSPGSFSSHENNVVVSSFQQAQWQCQQIQLQTCETQVSNTKIWLTLHTYRASVVIWNLH